MVADGRLDIQRITEKILAKHGIDPARNFYLELSLRSYIDLIIEKEGNQVLVGHYLEENGDLVSDPVLAMEDMNGYWHPLRIEQWCGDITCSFWENGKHMIIPENIKEFRSFQRIFARNIKEQGWLEDGVKNEND